MFFSTLDISTNDDSIIVLSTDLQFTFYNATNQTSKSYALTQETLYNAYFNAFSTISPTATQ